MKQVKGYVPIAFSSPQSSTGSSTFLMSNKSILIFSHYNPKISASNSLHFGSYSIKCTFFKYTNFDFLMSFHTASSQCHMLIFSLGEKMKSNLEVKLCKMCLTSQG